MLYASGVSCENVLFCFMAIHTDTNSFHFKQAACTINNTNPTEKSSFYYAVLKSIVFFFCQLCYMQKLTVHLHNVTGHISLLDPCL